MQFPAGGSDLNLLGLSPTSVRGRIIVGSLYHTLARKADARGLDCYASHRRQQIQHDTRFNQD